MDKRVLEIAQLIADNDPDWKDELIAAFDCIKDKPDYKLINSLLLPGNPGVVSGANLIEPELGGVAIGKFVSAYGVGTAYNLTNAQAAVDLGTTDPAIVLDAPGTYIVRAAVHIAFNGATITTQTLSPKVRRTNNTAADLSVVPVLDLPVITTLTHSYGIIQLPPFRYATPRSDDALAIYAALSAAAGAGQVEVQAIGTFITAERISDATS